MGSSAADSNRCVLVVANDGQCHSIVMVILLSFVICQLSIVNCPEMREKSNPNYSCAQNNSR